MSCFQQTLSSFSKLCLGLSLSLGFAAGPAWAGMTPDSIVPLEVRVDKVSAAQTISPNIRHAAKSLGLDEGLAEKSAEALKLVFARDYKGARKAFSNLQSQYPELAIGNVGRMLIFQCLMLENFDYRFERQYESHAALALRDIEKAQAIPGNEAWEYFLRGGVVGIQAIHEMRKSNYVSAMRKGMEALTALRALESHAPDFVDPDLGYGLFMYWRTVVGQRSKLIPEGEDRRALGIALIEKVEKKGAFIAPGASLALAYIYMEEGKARKAIGYSHRLIRRYPDNVINGLLHARLLMRLRRYKKALAVLAHVLATDSDNHRVHYYRATTHLRRNEFPEAQAAVDLFLSLDLEKDPRAYGLHRKADIFFRQKNYEAARSYYRQAISLNNYAPSKRRLARLDQMKQTLGK
jgi:tetratricopeptide (TPR) repeat protein